MSEIEKMYENAGIEYEERYNNCTLNKEGDCELKCSCDICKYSEEKYIYPPFTAEKQLAIFKIFCRRYLEVSQHVEENGNLCFGIKATVGDYAVGFNKDFAECLADFVNCLWQDLTEEEKQQVKGILE